MTYSEIALYADDTVLFNANSDITNACKDLQSDLNEFVKWTMKWRIAINPTKSQPKIFTLRKLNQPRQIKINNTVIPWLRNETPVKYLGVLLDQKLTWKNHIQEISNKTYAKINKLYPVINNKSSLSLECALSVFKSVIRPSLTYACQIWNNIANTHLKKLQIIQNKYLRKAVQAPWFIPNKQIHRELNIPPINEYIQQVSNRFFTLLPSCTSAQIFNLGKNASIPNRIISRYPKDSLKPP